MKSITTIHGSSATVALITNQKLPKDIKVPSNRQEQTSKYTCRQVAECSGKWRDLQSAVHLRPVEEEQRKSCKY